MSRNLPQSLRRVGTGLRSRPDLIVHTLSLLLVAGVVIRAGRGQWFYFDEWDFLAERDEWSLLSPHNGHLSFFPQLLTTLIKGVFGLHSYWPFLLPTIAVHVLIVHMIWRMARRAGAGWPVAVAVSTLFGVLAAGAENTLWAFQVGFITPLAIGLGALLIVTRPRLTMRTSFVIGAMLVVAAGFASTAIPMVAVVLLATLVRHGWRPMLPQLVVFGVVYGAWYVLLNREPTQQFGVTPGSIYDLLVVIPQYTARGFIDSFAKMLPAGDLGVVVFLALLAGAVLALRKVSSFRDMGVVYYPVIAGVVFAILTAYTRAGLGWDTASSGRYVYVYAAMFAPGIALLLSSLVRSSRPAVIVLCGLLAMLIGFNAASLVRDGATQAAVERHVERAMSAAVRFENDPMLAERTPASLLAPPLTMEDLKSFVDRGQFEPVAYTADDMLDVEINLFLRSGPVSHAEPDRTSCEEPEAGLVTVDMAADLVFAPTAGTVRVHADDAGATTEYATVDLARGWNSLSGVEVDRLRLSQPDAGGLCVVPRDRVN